MSIHEFPLILKKETFVSLNIVRINYLVCVMKVQCVGSEGLTAVTEAYLSSAM
jgi:hypothetical protein